MEEEEQFMLKVNKYDVLSVLLQTVANLIGSVSAMFSSLSQLSRAHSVYVDDKTEFQMAVSQDIEMLGGE